MDNRPLDSARAARSAAAALLVATAAAFAPGCVREPEATSCPTGIYCPAGAACATRQAICVFDGCGDGVVGPGEVCDDGDVLEGRNESSGTCNSDCTSNERCGNRFIDEAMGEVCDDGNTVDGDRCSADCTSTEACGNGILDEGEQCDAKVLTAFCTTRCTVSREGDGFVNPLAGEDCDGGDGSIEDDCQAADCNADCSFSVHGDGVVNPLHDGEECDDGDPVVVGDTCQSARCTVRCTVSRHGDGIVNPQHDAEACDGGDPSVPGDTCESPACTIQCTPSEHGDGIVNPQHDAEECDDGDPLVAGDGCGSTTCDADCTPTVCGDGHVNLLVEECDDGNDLDDDDCVACRWARCGDGHQNVTGTLRPTERCDLGDALNGLTDCPYGVASCVGCTRDTCQPIETMDTDVCGDGTLDAGFEDCDAQASRLCGTCSPSCTAIDVAAATGTITVTSKAVADGEFLVVHDGLGHSITIEFDTGNGCAAAGASCVEIQANDTINQVAGKIDGIVDNAAALLISSSVKGTNRCSLTNTAAGVAGNVAIETGSPSGAASTVVVAPAAGAVVVDGMAGGVGCPSGDACFASPDCVGGTCTGNVCE